MSSDVCKGTRSRSATFTRGGATEETNRLPVDAVFDLLSSEHRRHLLYYLIDVADGETTATDAAEHLCTAVGTLGVGDRESVLVALHHRHLPKMEAVGVIEYRGRGETIRYLGDPLVEDCLARVAPRDVGRQQ